MIQTSVRRTWFRFICALVAGLVAGFSAPMPSGVSTAQAGVANQAKIYVFPFQAVFKGVPREITTQAGDLLKNEIKQNDEVQLQKGPIFIPEAVASQAEPLSDKDLKQAGKLLAKGVKHYQGLQLDKAHKAFSAALAKYEKSLALMADFSPVVDTLLMLSVCSYRLDREGEGAKMLVKVIRLRPALVLDPEKYPPMFRNTMDTIRKRLLRKTRGELEVVANADGATVFFDGNKVGTTPILLKDLVPGEHYVRVEKDELQTFASKTVIVPTKKVRVAATLGGVKKVSGPLGAIAEAIRSNSINHTVLNTIVSQGKEIGADFVVVGGVAKVGDNFKVGSYLIKVGSKSVCPMTKIEFDPDLLGASVEVFNMATDMVKRVEGCPDPAKLPVRVVDMAVKKKVEIKAVAVGPAVPPPEAKRPAPLAKVELAPTRGPAVAVAPTRGGPALPVRAAAEPAAARGPARPGVVAPRPAPVRRQPAPVAEVKTSDGLATVGSSALQPRPDPLVMPQVPQAQRGMPIIEDEKKNRGPKWYGSWWFWSVVGVVAVGGAAGGMYAAGVFDGGTSGGSVNVNW